MNATAMRVTAESQVRSQIQGLFEKLDDWDLKVIKKWMVQKGIYSAEEIDDAETEYKRWLAIAGASHGKTVPISEGVDHFWHSHILFTQDYANMCQCIFGRFIHHRPSILDDQKMLNQAFKVDTMALYRQNFGEPDPKFWDTAVCICAGND